MGFSIEPITKRSWQIRHGKMHEVYGDAFTGALRISEVDEKTVEVCALVNLPPRKEIEMMKQYFYDLGYERVIRRRMKDGQFEEKEL